MSKKTGLSGRPALDSFETVGGDLTDVVVDVADTGRDSPSERTGGSRDRVTAPHTIVGIGASAGGLAAFKELLRHLPADSGMAFVLIQHLDASHKSLLVEALASATQMPVQHVEDDSVAQPDHVYVIPPGADISMKGERFALVPRTGQKAHLHLPVDFFFTALAAERGRNAIGVVLSGSATDGTEGLRAIKSDGGITFAQEPGTTTHPSMPASAIEAGVVDHVLAIPQLAEELVRLSRDPYVAGSEPPMGARDTDRTTLARITDIVRAVVGVDFGEHKTPTFERRLARRMAVRRLHDRESYLRLLEQDIDEVRTLYEDALIHVSSFFRDPEVFAALKTKVFPEILRHKAEGAPIRVWAAGCSTGEEAYSVAMALIEFLGDQAHPHPVQIFGSDLSEIAIRTARGGRYSDGAMRGIDEERRHRYFTRLDSCYQINKNVRDLCVFVRHDLARDPPFSKLDLVSCRNVLIYFEPTLQRRVLPTFHYSLGQPGFLLLGRTEHVSGFSQLFTPTDERSKIYERSATPSTLRFSARSEKHVIPERVRAPGTKAPRGELDVSRHLDQLLLARYAPPGVLVNEELQILQFRGKTAGYLEAAQGAPQQSLARMVPAGFRSKVQAALARAKSEGAAVTVEGVELEREGSTRTCDLVVLPFAGMPENRDPLFVVLFQEAPRGSSVTARAPASPAPSPPNEPGRIARLEHELAATSEYLRTLIEEQSRTSDDLGSANEELVSGNEELQTLNEELETAKEELQSINEELTTVNDELRHRNEEVSLINSDLANLLDTVDIPIVIVDKNRRIRRFSPQAPKLLNVLPTDIGRLLDDITPNLEVADMPARIADVIAASAATSSEVQDRDGRWHRMQIRPHRAADGSVDGAIVSLLDIDAIRHHLGEAEKAKEQAERADRAKDEFLAVLSHELRTPLSVLVMQTQLLRQGGGTRRSGCEPATR